MVGFAVIFSRPDIEDVDCIHEGVLTKVSSATSSSPIKQHARTFGIYNHFLIYSKGKADRGSIRGFIDLWECHEIAREGATALVILEVGYNRLVGRCDTMRCTRKVLFC